MTGIGPQLLPPPPLRNERERDLGHEVQFERRKLSPATDKHHRRLPPGAGGGGGCKACEQGQAERKTEMLSGGFRRRRMSLVRPAPLPGPSDPDRVPLRRSVGNRRKQANGQNSPRVKHLRRDGTRSLGPSLHAHLCVRGQAREGRGPSGVEDPRKLAG